MGIKRAIFLDRDGTLINDKGYAYKLEDFELLPGVIQGLRLLQEKFLFFIITNQSGIGKGFYTIKEFCEFNNFLITILKEHDIRIEMTFFCPHINEDMCECKKPKPKFIDLVYSEFDINLTSSWVIGDHPSDIVFGKNTGCKTIFLLTGHGNHHLRELQLKKISPTCIAQNFMSAANYILKDN